MQCNEFRDHIFDFLTEDPSGAGEEARKHMSACASCAAEVNSFQSTMSLLDEWKAPEDTSPYFMTRLRARVREEQQKETSKGWLAWLRKPAIAVGSMALLLFSISLYQGRSSKQNGQSGKTPLTIAQGATNVSLVKDLQSLDKDEDMLADFELLDDVPDSPAQVN